MCIFNLKMYKFSLKMKFFSALGKVFPAHWQGFLRTLINFLSYLCRMKTKQIVCIFLIITGCMCGLAGCRPAGKAFESRLNTLRTPLDALLKDKRAEVGVTVLADGDTLLYNNDRPYPLLSVFKLHVAMAVLHRMEMRQTSPDSVITVRPSDLLPDTYSPLRDRHPEGNVRLTLRQLLHYSVALSDNNACDLLIRYAGGIDRVNAYIRSLGISDIHLSETEASMHRDVQRVYLNHATPLSVVSLLKKAYEEDVLHGAYRECLWQTLLSTQTGMDKLKAGLPPDVQLGHKTGSSDRDEKGMKAADNDAGAVFLPDGRRYYIAVFVTRSYESDKINADLIARISKMVYEELVR